MFVCWCLVCLSNWCSLVYLHCASQSVNCCNVAQHQHEEGRLAAPPDFKCWFCFGAADRNGSTDVERSYSVCKFCLCLPFGFYKHMKRTKCLPSELWGRSAGHCSWARAPSTLYGTAQKRVLREMGQGANYTELLVKQKFLTADSFLTRLYLSVLAHHKVNLFIWEPFFIFPSLSVTFLTPCWLWQPGRIWTGADFEQFCLFWICAQEA